MTTYDPPARLVGLRLLARPYRYGGIRLQRRALLLVFISASLVWAAAGPQFVRLFAPSLTSSDLLILTALGATIYLIDDLVTFAAIAPQLRKLQRWFDEPVPADAADAWRTAAEIPLAPMLRPVSLAFLAGLNLLWIIVLIRLLHLPLISFLLFFPGAVVFRFYWLVLRSMLTEQMMRPVLADISRHVTDFGRPVRVRVGLAYRLLGTIPLIAVLAGTIVAGLVGPHTIRTLAIGVGLSAAISVTIASPLLLLVTRSVTEPLRDLRRAADRVGDGDFSVRVPITSTDEIGLLATGFNAMTEGLAERERIRTAFGTYVDPAIVDHILADGGGRLAEGEEVEITALFMDVRGFTGYSEQHPAREVVAMLNRLFAAVVPIVGQHGGYVDKFIGDGLLAVFGVPQRCSDHADRALAAALDIAATLHDRDGDPDVGIGLNSGTVVAGNLGGSGRFDFTVIGDPVNVAARVESATRQTGDTILLSQHTWELLSPAARADTVGRPAVPLKGKTQTVSLYAPATTQLGSPVDELV
ncbi:MULTISPECIES: adenylate/guanylate cyclase domain-containing protein [unclassified Mycolicibacterium]|uniref:adenylate/guanylate cyclase domain-containing protein n=1 Tax=unclassified Mycolicibacterium TaxID=2636767 RepID=UPI00139138A7|nr:MULTISPECIES: adenylate/guanylate cyclase domain-containing protein [unclassified Mycolicibacterium]